MRIVPTVVPLIALLLTLGAALATHGGTVSAEPAQVLGGETGCVLAELADGELNFVSAGFHAVLTQSANGNITLVCTASHLSNSAGKTLHFDYESTGAQCLVPSDPSNPEDPGVPTTHWQQTLSASGNAVLVCHVR